MGAWRGYFKERKSGRNSGPGEWEMWEIGPEEEFARAGPLQSGLGVRLEWVLRGGGEAGSEGKSRESLRVWVCECVEGGLQDGRV